MKQVSMSVLIISFLIVTAVHLTAGEAKCITATCDIYYDVATGHKYIKNVDQSYREYSRKGLLFRESVPNTLPLLTSNKNIRKVPGNCYFLYQKSGYPAEGLTALPSNTQSPVGWKCVKMLVTSN